MRPFIACSSSNRPRRREVRFEGEADGLQTVYAQVYPGASFVLFQPLMRLFHSLRLAFTVSFVAVAWVGFISHRAIASRGHQ